MTGHGARRRAAWLAGAAAIMPVAALSAADSPAPAAKASQFQPPAAPMVLTRVLRRPLPGGAEVKTLRSYEVRFVSDGSGYRIDGQLIDAEIEVPAPYEALAAIERARPDDGMFPIHLDGEGRLLPTSEQYTAKSAREASAIAMKRVGGLGLPTGEARQANEFVGQFASRPARTPWPDDLFNPAPGHRRQTKSVPLPDGSHGRVSIDIDARTHGPSGLLASFARTVTTELEGSARVTEETWTLSDKS